MSGKLEIKERAGQKKCRIADQPLFAERRARSICKSMSVPSSPNIFSLERVTSNRDRAAPLFSDHAFLRQHLSTQLLERLGDVSRFFNHTLDFGAQTGLLAQQLRQSDQVGEIVCYEPSQKMLDIAADAGFKSVRGGFEKLPFADDQFELVVSLQALHWVNNVPAALAEIRRVLKPDGLFLAGLFGGGTLKELRTALVEAESEIAGGVSPRLSPLPQLHDVAALVQRTGFALPVVDSETVRVRYSHPMKLLTDLKGMGEQAAFAPQNPSLRRPLSRRILARMSEIYQARYSDPDGKVGASFEVIWVSGWAPAPGQPKPLKPGSAKYSLAAALRPDKGLDAGED